MMRLPIEKVLAPRELTTLQLRKTHAKRQNTSKWRKRQHRTALKWLENVPVHNLSCCLTVLIMVHDGAIRMFKLKQCILSFFCVSVWLCFLASVRLVMFSSFHLLCLFACAFCKVSWPQQCCHCATNTHKANLALHVQYTSSHDHCQSGNKENKSFTLMLFYKLKCSNCVRFHFWKYKLQVVNSSILVYWV